MSQPTPDSPEDSFQPVPTVEEERHFLAQCEYIDRSLTAVGRMVRSLLRDRGWRSSWSPEDQDIVYIKDFPDGQTQYLEQYEAYYFEQEHARQFFRHAKIAMKPRGRKAPPQTPAAE